MRFRALQPHPVYQPSRPGMCPQTLQLSGSPGNLRACLHARARVCTCMPETEPKASAQKARSLKVDISSKEEPSSP